jgi:pyruvate dehydrogenase E1 component
VTLAGVGVMLPETLAAAAELEDAGIAADVVCLTSPTWSSGPCRRGAAWPTATRASWTTSLPAERAAPIVTVLDGHPHTLAFLGAVRRVPVTSLGVQDFGQSGDVGDLYAHFGLDTDTIVGAALDLLGR